VRIGLLKTRLQILAPTEVSDGIGGTTTTWTPGSHVWARVSTLSSRESLRNQIVLADSYEIVTRYTSEIVATSRLTDGTTTWAITGLVASDSDRGESVGIGKRVLTLTAQKVVA
jgi:SPP1 family predicted phage head-tail adaptor